MDAKALIALVESAVNAPPADQRRLIKNLHYILENLEVMHQRHRVPKATEADETLRQSFLQHLAALYQGLETLELGLIHADPERLKAAQELVGEAANGLEALDQRIENSLS